MTGEFGVEFLPVAYSDLEEIVEYIEKDDPIAAIGTIEKIGGSIAQLETFPRMGVVPNDIRLRYAGYRMLIIDHYIVFYVIDNDVIEIRRIVHGRRLYSFLL